MASKFILFFLLLFGICSAQDVIIISEEKNITPLIDGTLIIPETSDKLPLVIIIQGSGPIDRNGNQFMQKNNSLSFLAEWLYTNGIASFRYDKRIVKLLSRGTLIEKDIKFGDYIADAISIIDYFKEDERFSKIIIIGHSQGSLVGMIAAQGRADEFISLAGAGQEIDYVILDQLAIQIPGLKDNARQAFDDLRVNGVTINYSPGLASIFRPAIQQFLLEWMQYNPQVEIVKLYMPVLIINGDRDIQVEVSEAEKLKAAKPDAQYVIIPFMNHIFKKIKGDDLVNSKSYNEYNRPVMPELIEIISKFIQQ